MSEYFKRHAPRKASLILASASPRRAELLREAGVKFEVMVSPSEEPERKPGGVPTEAWPMCLAYMKAKAVREHLRTGRKGKLDGRVILAADTIVVDGKGGGDRILNKARDRGHARQMLRGLQGKTHRVITGICLMQGQRVRLASAEAVCRVKRMSRAWLEGYLDSGMWKGKAGAYGIQDAGDPFVELVSGEFTTVVGLPMGLVQSELASF